MKYNKKQALKFAVYEKELREPYWGPPDYEPDWTLAQEVEQEEYHKNYLTQNNAARSIATMMLDKLFQTTKKVKQAKRFYGKMLWEKALEKFVIGDHDI